MKRSIIFLLCLTLVLQLAAFGAAAVPAPAQAEQSEVSGLEAFTQQLEEAYTVVKTPGENGVTIVELVMPTQAPEYVEPVQGTVLLAGGKAGDLDGSGSITVNDVVKLLLYISMPDMFSIQGNGDLDKDGEITSDDAVKLLLHISMPDIFPLEGEEPEPTEPEMEGHQALSYTERYLYNTLTEEQKGWYRNIDKAVKNLEEKVALGNNLPEDAYNILFLYLMDNPEHFYLCNQIGIYVYGSEYGLYLSYSDGTNSSGYGIGDMTQALKNGIADKKAKFNQRIDKILSKIPTNIPDVEKEKMAYDHLLLNSYYNIDAINNNLWDGLANDNWTAYGVMVHGKGVCESYAEAFQVLCLKMGINCTGIAGFANGGGHKWNAVELDGEWYACDVTFDDPIGGAPDVAYHEYFNRTTQDMVKMDHITPGSDFPGPNCAGTKYSYENYFK